MDSRMADTIEEELNAIRLELYEEIKDMTPEEEVTYIRAQTAPIIKQYGLKVSNLKPVTPRRKRVAMIV